MTWTHVAIGKVIQSSQYGLSIATVPDGSLPIVGMKDIQDGIVLVDNSVCVKLDGAAAAPYLLRDGDILINRTNSPDLVGKAGIYRGSEAAVFASYLVRLEVDRQKIDPEFLIQILASEQGQRNIRQLATRAVGQANLNPTGFKKHFRIPIPALREQREIRDVLCSWNMAVEKTVRLIALKTACLAAQRERCLSHPRRARRIKLNAVSSESASRNGGSFDRGKVMAVTKQVGMRPMRVETMAANISRYKVVRPNAFAYNPMRLNIGSIVMSPFDFDVLVSPDYVVFECDETKLLPGYLNHLRYTRQWANYFDTAGGGSVRVRIYYDDLGAFSFALPNVEVQAGIVAMLDSASKEIAMLGQYVEALKRQKRGLMQKLLTGQWRVKAPDPEAA